MTHPPPPGIPARPSTGRTGRVTVCDQTTTRRPDSTTTHRRRAGDQPRPRRRRRSSRRPQPVRPARRPAGRAAGDPMDIDSPFLDLFGGTPARRRPGDPAPPRPSDSTRRSSTLGADGRRRPARRAAAARRRPPARRHRPPGRRSPRRRAAARPPSARRSRAPSRHRRPPAPGPRAGEPAAATGRVRPTAADGAGRRRARPPAEPLGRQRGRPPTSGAPCTRGAARAAADFVDGPADADSDSEDWPDEPARPVADRAGARAAAAPAPSAAPPSRRRRPAPARSRRRRRRRTGRPRRPAPTPAPTGAPRRPAKAPGQRRAAPRGAGEPAGRRPKREVKPVAAAPHKLKFSDRDPADRAGDHRDRRAPDLHPEHGHRLVLAARGALGVPARRRARGAAVARSPSSTPAWPASGCTCAAPPGRSRPTSGPAPSTRTPPTRCPTCPAPPSWSDHLVAAQRHLLSVNHAEGQTYLGVTFARRSLGDTLRRADAARCSAGRRRRRAAQAGPHRRAVRRGARRVRHARPPGHRRRSWSGCSTARSRCAWRRPGTLSPVDQRAVGTRRPARADRAGRALPHPVRLDGQAGQPDDRRGAARRRALRRPDGAAGDPRAARAVAALPRAAAVADGALLADRHPRLRQTRSATSSTGSG